MSFPLVPALALSILSILSSGFVILKVAISIISLRPLGPRQRPSADVVVKRTLTVSDKCHVWLTLFDMTALGLFIWHVVSEVRSSPLDAGNDGSGAARLWFVLTARQIYLFVVTVTMAIYARTGYAVTFGRVDYLLWAPAVGLTIVSTVFAGIFAHFGIISLMPSLAVCSIILAVGTTLSLGLLWAKWFRHRRIFSTREDSLGSQFLASKTRAGSSFETEDINSSKSRSSWNTLVDNDAAGPSGSPFPFSMRSSSHLGPSRVPNNRYPSLKDSGTSCDHVLPMAAGISSSSSNLAVPMVSDHTPLQGPNPITGHNAYPSSVEFPVNAHNSDQLSQSFNEMELSRYQGSIDSSLRSCEIFASSGASHSHLVPTPQPPVTLTQRLSPLTTRFNLFATRHATPAPVMDCESPSNLFLALCQDGGQEARCPSGGRISIRGGCDRCAGALCSKAKHSYTPRFERAPTVLSLIGWLIAIWVPLALSLPYFVRYSPYRPFVSQTIPLMVVISVTITSPLLALQLVFSAPLPSIPAELSNRAHLPAFREDDGRIIPGFLERGDAATNRKCGRAIGQSGIDLGPLSRRTREKRRGGAIHAEVLHVTGRASGLPIPVIRILGEDDNGDCSLEWTRTRKESSTSSYRSRDTDTDSNGHVEIAERHYSTIAKARAVTITPSPTLTTFAGTNPNQQICSRPVSSMSQSSLHKRSRSAPLCHNAAPTPPPNDPLPPTPDSAKSHARARSSGYIISSASSLYGSEEHTPLSDGVNGQTRLPFCGMELHQSFQSRLPLTVGGERNSKLFVTELDDVILEHVNTEIFDNDAMASLDEISRTLEEFARVDANEVVHSPYYVARQACGHSTPNSFKWRTNWNSNNPYGNHRIACNSVASATMSSLSLQTPPSSSLALHKVSGMQSDSNVSAPRLKGRSVFE